MLLFLLLCAHIAQISAQGMGIPSFIGLESELRVARNSVFAASLYLSCVQHSCRPGAHLQTMCSIFAGPVQHIDRPGALYLQVLCTTSGRPVYLQARWLAGRLV